MTTERFEKGATRPRTRLNSRRDRRRLPARNLHKMLATHSLCREATVSLINIPTTINKVAIITKIIIIIRTATSQVLIETTRKVHRGKMRLEACILMVTRTMMMLR